MTPDQLKAWMAWHGYSKAELHRATNVSRVTIDGYLSGKHEVTELFKLALKALER